MAQSTTPVRFGACFLPCYGGGVTRISALSSSSNCFSTAERGLVDRSGRGHRSAEPRTRGGHVPVASPSWYAAPSHLPAPRHLTGGRGSVPCRGSRRRRGTANENCRGPLSWPHQLAASEPWNVAATMIQSRSQSWLRGPDEHAVSTLSLAEWYPVPPHPDAIGHSALRLATLQTRGPVETVESQLHRPLLFKHCPPYPVPPWMPS